MKRTIGMLLLGLVFLSGCRNTAHGIGQDMERAGEKIQNKTD